MGQPRASKTRRIASLRPAQARRAAILLKHVSDTTRLKVVLMLSEGEMPVGALCDGLGQSQPAVSRHLTLLRLGGIISLRRQGTNNFYSLTETGAMLASVVNSLTGTGADLPRVISRVEARGNTATYKVVYEPNEHNGYTVTVPALRGLVTEGRDMEEAKVMAREAIECHLEGMVKDGEEVPRADKVSHDTITVPIPEA
jgi:DNA-binding transcriptional ArsR family regulator